MKSMASNWRFFFRCRAPEDLYPLLVKFETNSSGYSIHLTDLINIWSERVDRKDIVRRALDVDTSIDPSEGGDQLKLLLQNLAEAINGRPHTSLSLTKTADNGLLLQATTSLPSPLPPLVWPFHLRSASPELFSHELVLPCLGSIVRSKSQVSSLLNQIKEKDNVIARLLLKLRSAGIEPNTVFPHISMQRRPKANMQEAIFNSTKGLGEFDEEKWRKSIDTSSEPKMHVDFLCEQVFADDEFGVQKIELPSSLRKWRGCGELMAISPRPEYHFTSPLMTHNTSSSSPDTKRTCDTNEENFQRQTTPKKDMTAHIDAARDEDAPVIGTPATHNLSHSLDTGSTTSGSDDDLEMQSLPTRPQKTPASRSELAKVRPKKLGLVGGNHDKEDNAVLSTQTPFDDDLKPARKLGMIGGKHAQSESDDRVRKSPYQTNENKLSASIPSGSIVDSESSPSRKDLERKERSPVKSPPVPAHTRETSEERADRKRAQLKRELEEKSKVQVKKKRRF